MNKHTSIATALTLAALLAAPLAQATSIAKADYKAGKTSISAAYKADHSACDAQAGNARDICREEAKAKKKIARAQLEFDYSGKATDQRRVHVARAEASYAVAKERCDDKAGNDKDVCVKEAKALRDKTLADIKLGKAMGEARSEASDTKREADYKVLAEKCEALAGDAKASCIANAKLSVGKV
jgi:hypothetical protein